MAHAPRFLFDVELSELTVSENRNDVTLPRTDVTADLPDVIHWLDRRQE